MQIKEIKETPTWGLYEKGRNYHRKTNIYTDTDRNYRFYNGNQWEGAKLGDVEPVQKNFIKPVVKYKCSVIHDNLYAINFSSQNYEMPSFRKNAERYCEMLNGYAARIWERDKMDFKGRRITKDAAINDEGIIYVWFDNEKMYPVNEIVKKNDIYYGNENDDDIQAQPYILIRKRMAIANAIELALREGMSESKIDEVIIGDNDTFEESGDAAKEELDNNVTLIYKFYKENGTVKYSLSTRWCDITEGVDTGLTLYPIAHFNWEEKEGSARGEGEVRFLIPNQIEVNRTEVRRVLTVKYQAYPHKVVDTTKVSNLQALNTVGGIIKTNGTIEDVHKVVGVLQPAQMSQDVVKLQEDLINVTRELAGAGDTATGQVNPESASGRAILAVQQASQAPMTEQKESYKNFVEDLAKIWLEYLIVNAADGVNLEEEVTDPKTGEATIQLVNVPQSALEQLQATVKIDVTPKGVYDRFAQEQTIENLLINGLFSAQRLSEFKAYVKALPNDSVAPKMILEEIVAHAEEEQRKIAMIEARAQMMQQRAQQFLMEDPDGQAQQIADAQMQLLMQKEAEYAEQEAELDEETAEAEEKTDEE